MAVIGMAKMGTGLAILSGFITKTFLPALWTSITAVARLGIAFMSTPIGWITAGIAAVAVAGFLLIKNWSKVKEFWSGLWDGITAKTQAAMSIIMPLINIVRDGFDFITNNPITRGASHVLGAISGNSEAKNIQAQNARVDTGGEIRIVIDESRRTQVSAKMNNPKTDTVVDQGVLMGGAL